MTLVGTVASAEVLAVCGLELAASLDWLEAASLLLLFAEEELAEVDAGAVCWLLAAVSSAPNVEPSLGARLASFALLVAAAAGGACTAIALVEMAANQKIRIEPIPTKQRPDQFIRSGKLRINDRRHIREAKKRAA